MTRSTGRVDVLRSDGMDLSAFPRIAELYTSITEYAFASSLEMGLDAVLDAIAGFADRFPDRSTP